MNEKEILEFYRRVVFGKKYGKISNQLMTGTSTQDLADKIKRVCFLTAWNDMAMHQKGINVQYKKIAININYKLEYKKDKKTGISTNEIIKRKDFIDDVYEKCKQYLDNSPFNSQNAINSLNNSVFNNHFEIGKIQKIVNMYYKYLFTFTFNIPALTIQSIFGTSTPNFDGCDCPIDNYILKSLKLKKKYTWSKLDINEYNKIQKEIKTKLKSGQIPLDYDFKNFG